jgi:DegV family protein with EDD domain
MSDLSVHLSDFVSMVIRGARALQQQEKYLNQINVFPVADADTGSNMTYSVSKIQADLQTVEKSNDVTEVLDTIATSVVLNSRGNSGTLLSQFFKGVCSSLSSSQEFTPLAFREAFSLANDEAWKSFDDPQKGTVLDIIEVLSLVEAREDQSIEEYFQICLESAEAALEKTKTVHPVMKKSHVVDSGAAGLVVMLKGWYQVLDGVEDDISDLDMHLNLPSDIHINSEYQYCTECVIENSELSPEEIRAAIDDLGEYIQVVDFKNYIKVHIHTDTPDEFKSVMSSTGSVLSFKVDDMYAMQQENAAEIHTVKSSNPELNGKFVIISDTSTDLPELEKTSYHFATIPVYEEGVLDVNLMDNMTPDQFYQRMERESDFVPKTSKASVGDFLKLFKQLGEEYEYIICVTISSGISATYQSAKLAREQYGYPDKVILIDSQLGGPATGLLVRNLQSQLTSEDSPASVRETSYTIIDNISALFVVDDMEYLRRSGRVSSGLSKVGKLLKMKPMLTMKDGKITKKGLPMIWANQEKTVAKLCYEFDHINAISGGTKQVYLVYAGEKGKALADRVRSHVLSEGLDAEDVLMTPLNVVVGAHTGPGTVGMMIYAGD